MAEDLRATILRLAVASIDAGGEAAIRVNHLAAEAGVGPPMLYRFFGSRDGLVIAAQVERYTRQVLADVAGFERAIADCASSDELRSIMEATWTTNFARRAPTRWMRLSAMGSAYARPDLDVAIAEAQGGVIAEIVRVLEPCRERGWFRPGVDLVAAVTWQHSVQFSRVFVEHGRESVDAVEWDRIALDSMVRTFFGG